jgi:hypothetical protein
LISDEGELLQRMGATWFSKKVLLLGLLIFFRTWSSRSLSFCKAWAMASSASLASTAADLAWASRRALRSSWRLEEEEEEEALVAWVLVLLVLFLLDLVVLVLREADLSSVA